MQIVVCSTSTLKLGAVGDAVHRVFAEEPEILPIPSVSGIRSQPVGDVETLTGALRRVTLAAQRPASGHHRYLVGIENGLVTRLGSIVDLAYIAVVGPYGEITVRSSRCVQVPQELVEEARRRVWTRTCGQLEAARTPGVDPVDPHVLWSGGKTSRRALLADAVEEALRVALDATIRALQEAGE